MPQLSYTELDDRELIDLNKKVNTWLASMKGKICVDAVTYHYDYDWSIWSCRLYYSETN